MARDSAKLPSVLVEVPAELWPLAITRVPEDTRPIRVLRSREFLVQVFRAPSPVLVRISVNRTAVTGDRWTDNIPWDDLQGIKNQVGYPMHDAVEIFPVSTDVVNVANMRHLWVLDQPVGFAWRRP